MASPASARRPGRIDLDVVNVDVRNVLRLVADVGHVNLVLGEEVSGNVTLTLHDVPWEFALRTALSAKGLDLERSGNLIRVARAETLAKEREARVAAKQTCLDTAPLETHLVPVSHANAQELAALIRPTLTKRGSVAVDARTNTLIVSDVTCE
jgi:type IV pilus assembly protein PilQ